MEVHWGVLEEVLGSCAMPGLVHPLGSELRLAKSTVGASVVANSLVPDSENSYGTCCLKCSSKGYW